MIAKKICALLGHKWRYNHKSMPSKAICKRCKCKSIFDPFTFYWTPVDSFSKERRTDQELIKTWIA